MPEFIITVHRTIITFIESCSHCRQYASHELESTRASYKTRTKKVAATLYRVIGFRICSVCLTHTHDGVSQRIVIARDRRAKLRSYLHDLRVSYIFFSNTTHVRTHYPYITHKMEACSAAPARCDAVAACLSPLARAWEPQTPNNRYYIIAHNPKHARTRAHTCYSRK